jgi:NADPH-dependent 2,4-dienoyl-CoA reductase/sulfur reductase-like enzyme
VVLKDDDDIPCSIVIMGTGVQPATGFLADSGFKLEDDKGIAVDEYLQVDGKQNIYALGDIAHWPDHKNGEKRRIEHWQVAVSTVPEGYSVWL